MGTAMQIPSQLHLIKDEYGGWIRTGKTAVTFQTLVQTPAARYLAKDLPFVLMLFYKR